MTDLWSDRQKQVPRFARNDRKKGQEQEQSRLLTARASAKAVLLTDLKFEYGEFWGGV
jgi:hypothetical protein